MGQINCIFIASYFMKEMLFANGSNFPNVVDKANISFCRSIAFTDVNVPKTLQEISPSICSYPVPQSQSDFMILIVVSLNRREGEMKAGYDNDNKHHIMCTECLTAASI